MKAITLKGGQKYIPVEERFSLIPIEKAVAEVSEACELLLQCRDLEPLEMREHLVRWVFGKLREKYGENWLEVWEAYCHSDLCGCLLERVDDNSKANLMRQVDEILKNSDFGEE